MILANAEPGERLLIKRILGDNEVRRHLASLGFVVDEIAEVVSNNNGNVIVTVKGVKLALDRSLALQIGG